MYTLPSASQICAPRPRLINGGVPPTERNARTGELTPPGVKQLRRAKQFLAFSFSVMNRIALRIRASGGRNVGRVENSAEITATASAPASINCGALVCVIPPIATIGTSSFRFASEEAMSGDALHPASPATEKNCRTRRNRRRRACPVRALDRVVARSADQFRAARARSRARENGVFAAQMHAAASTSARELQIVVDDERTHRDRAHAHTAPLPARGARCYRRSCCGIAQCARRLRAPRCQPATAYPLSGVIGRDCISPGVLHARPCLLRLVARVVRSSGIFFARPEQAVGNVLPHPGPKRRFQRLPRIFLRVFHRVADRQARWRSWRRSPRRACSRSHDTNPAGAASCRCGSRLPGHRAC